MKVRTITVTSQDSRCYADLDGYPAMKSDGATADEAIGLLAVKSSIVAIEALYCEKENGRWVARVPRKNGRGFGSKRVQAIGDLVRNHGSLFGCTVVTR